jgi:hypothetical protein
MLCAGRRILHETANYEEMSKWVEKLRLRQITLPMNTSGRSLMRGVVSIESLLADMSVDGYLQDYPSACRFILRKISVPSPPAIAS